mmetsp:Transcript_68849/g.217681  ORF Transcript_68849/g.217681 Transcript_68849/m.217681 type:complete len:220 (-) Transcript_68849:50-709(-)
MSPLQQPELDAVPMQCAELSCPRMKRAGSPLPTGLAAGTPPQGAVAPSSGDCDEAAALTSGRDDGPSADVRTTKQRGPPRRGGGMEPQANVEVDGSSISPEGQVEGLPARTTWVLIKNIPRRCTAEEILFEMIQQGFEGCFDLFDMPVDRLTKRNKGMALVNFSEEVHARRFVQEFHGRPLRRYATQRALEVSLAHWEDLGTDFAQHLAQDMVQRPQDQ